MNVSELPCCYYPTTVMLIDDSTSFLTSVELQLHKQNIATKTYNDPKAALNYLLNDYQVDPSIDNCIEHYSNLELDDYDQHSVVKVDNLYKQVFNPNRYEQISVLIVDQSMPELSGMDLCRALRNLPFKIVMLTGATSTEDVISAFNEGIIDKYVSKNDLHHFDDLIAVIKELQLQYFYQRSRTVMQNIMLGQTAIKYKSFLDIFNFMLKRHNIVEFYMSQHEGSYLFLNHQGEPVWLLTESTEQMAHWLEVAISHERHDAIIEQLESHKILFYLDNNFSWPKNDSTWLKNCYNAMPLPDSNYYYAVALPELEKPIFELLKSQKMFCYHDFLTMHCR